MYLKETSSTNNFLRGYIHEHPETPCWQSVYTDFQTEGKGQSGNHWSSERGKNLTMSFLFNPSPKRAAFRPFDICVMVSLAVRQAVLEYVSQKEVNIKWPNDIFIGDKKVAGILIENEWEGEELAAAIVGVGVNLNQLEFGADAPNATSVLLERDSRVEIDIPKFMKRTLHEMTKIWRQMTHDFVRPRDEYNMLLYRKDGQRHLFQIQERGELEAVIQGVDEYGRLSLLLTKEQKVESFGNKEVAYII